MEITKRIEAGDLSMKPGWVRLSLHPTMTEDELLFIADAIEQLADNAGEWEKDYCYNSHTNEFNHKSYEEVNLAKTMRWFETG